MREAIHGAGRSLLDNPLCVSAASGAGYGIDVDGLREHARAGAEVMLFCNPQNPTGRAFTREELDDVARIVLENDLVVVSDEIHSDLVYGGRRHIPFASLSPEIAARTVTINSATKSFNIAGLRCAVMQFGSRALMDRFFQRIPRRLLGQPAISGIDATVAAWTDPRSQDWLDNVLAYLESRRDWLACALREEIPSIHMYAPQATYLAWLDCAPICGKLSASQWALDRAGIACSPGETFSEGYGAHMRLNFATSPEVLGIMFDRLRKAAADTGG
jgi:cystathionine beta-lyase